MHPITHISAALLIASLSATSTAAELLIARGDGFYPPNEMVIDGKLTGFHVDLINEVGKSIGLEVKWQSVPWARAQVMAKNGEVDALSYVSKTPEREQFGYFIDGNVTSTTQNGFFVPKGNPKGVKYSGDLKLMQPFAFGTIRGFSYSPEFDQASFLRKDDGAANEEQLLVKFSGGRFDVGIGVVSRIRYIAEQMKLGDSLEFIKPYLNERPAYLMFCKAKSKDGDATARKFADAMTAFKKTPRYGELLQKYKLER